MQCTEPFLRRRIFSENMGDGKIRFCQRYKSVSYTHLDVYKRQGKRERKFFPSIFSLIFYLPDRHLPKIRRALLGDSALFFQLPPSIPPCPAQ